MYQRIFSSNTKALRDYVPILPWQTNKIFVIAWVPFVVVRGILAYGAGRGKMEIK
jgi:hypothetical protein